MSQVTSSALPTAPPTAAAPSTEVTIAGARYPFAPAPFEDAEPELRSGLFPVFLDLSTVRVLIAGGGERAAEILGGLLAHSPDARVSVVCDAGAEAVGDLLAEYPGKHRVTCHSRTLLARDFAEAGLVIAATTSDARDAHVLARARAAGRLAYVAEAPGSGDIRLGEVVTRGSVTVGVAADKDAARVGDKVREVLEEVLPGDIHALLGRIEEVKGRLGEGLLGV